MEVHQPLVSIVTPMFNSGRFLRETIESVLSQHYTNWQMILADDGSTDDTIAIANEYCSRFPGKIIYTNHPGNANKGASATRNIAIEKAGGEYVALLDSDDVWKPEYLHQQVKFLVNNEDVDLVCEATVYWNSWDNVGAEDEIILMGAPAERRYEPPQLASILYPLGDGAAPCMCGILIKTSSLKKIGGFEAAFTAKDQLYEDQAFAIKNYLHNVVYISSRANNIYRQRSNSLMHGLVSEGSYDKGRYFFLQWLKRYLAEQQIDNVRINTLLSTALLQYKYPTIKKYSNICRNKLRQLKQVLTQ